MGLETATYIDGLVATNPTLGDPVSAGDDHLRLIKAAIKASFPNIAGAVSASHTEMSHLAGVTAGIQGQLDAKAAASHTHVEGDIADGLVFPRIDSTEVINGSWTFAPQTSFEDGIWAKQGATQYAGVFSASGGSEAIRIRYENLDLATNGKKWIDYFAPTYWLFGTIRDDNSNVKTVFGANRSGEQITNMEYGNTTDLPTHNFRGVAQFNYGFIATAGTIGSVTNTEIHHLVGATSNIQTQLNGKAATSHSHNDLYYTEAEVNALLAALTTSSTFTMSLRESSPSGTVIATGTASWTKTGNVVTLKVPANFWGLSSLGGVFYATGLPAAIQIAGSETASLEVSVTDNGTLKPGYVVIGGATPSSMAIGCHSGGFTASSGNKGFNYRSTLTYAIS